MAHLADSYIVYDGTTQVNQIVLDIDPVSNNAGAGTAAPEGSVAQVNEGGVGQLWLKVGPLDTDWEPVATPDIQLGIEPIGAGVNTLTVALPAAQDSTPYEVIVTLEGATTEPTMSVMMVAQTVNDFTVEFSGFTLTANYQLHWATRQLS